jgi:hypothetical protein
MILRLGLSEDDLPDGTNSDDEIVDELCTSGRLYRKVMRHKVLEQLREFF